MASARRSSHTTNCLLSRRSSWTTLSRPTMPNFTHNELFTLQKKFLDNSIAPKKCHPGEASPIYNEQVHPQHSSNIGPSLGARSLQVNSRVFARTFDMGTRLILRPKKTRYCGKMIEKPQSLGRQRYENRGRQFLLYQLQMKGFKNMVTLTITFLTVRRT